MKRPLLILATLVMSTLTTGACSDEGTPIVQPGPVDPAKYIGTWEAAGGTTSLNCSGSDPFTLMQGLTGVIQIQTATTAPLRATFSDPALTECEIFMDVQPTGATIRKGNVCALFHAFFSGTITLEGGTLTVDGDTGSLTMSGMVMGTLVTGQLTPEGCTGTFNTPLSRVSDDAGAPRFDATTASGTADAGAL